MKHKHIYTEYSTPTLREVNEKGDCAVRALAVAACVAYEKAHAWLKSKGRVDRDGTYHSTMISAIKDFVNADVEIIELGRIAYSSDRWTTRRANMSPTVATLLRDEKYRVGHWIMATTNHFFAVCDGVIHDWPGLGTKMRRRVMLALRIDATD